ncbi:FixJ family two-component response regulator [Rhodobium orientis]|uniref:DNA-binding response regulator n=1 Tax=Rhodobium orientis TaxID=34017 RepID=A0A327JEE6_9HYPH|nr:response regulator [Rhodobium orientis]MBB4303340.1 FixJ family two-component response regulator [Rhodobium orientis]MBK5951565.1 DNA-binding response regulator [Rhodobium orientis]RAI24709.1 DNA-binding response regulator [Rhodobium orientis]
MVAPTRDFSIYVVEDDPSVLKSLCALLNSHGYTTIACDSSESFLEVYDPEVVACLVLDLRMPGMSGLELQAHLNSLDAHLPTIVVTGHGDVPIAVQAMKAGAIEFIEKPAQVEQLLDAVAVAGEILANRPPPSVPDDLVRERIAKLTEREREVLDHLVLGKLNKEIAQELGVSQRTIEIHRSRIREKMHARGISDLIRMMR